MRLKNSTFDFLKWFCLAFIPSLEVLILSVGKIWGCRGGGASLPSSVTASYHIFRKKSVETQDVGRQNVEKLQYLVFEGICCGKLLFTAPQAQTFSRGEGAERSEAEEELGR